MLDAQWGGMVTALASARGGLLCGCSSDKRQGSGAQPDATQHIAGIACAYLAYLGSRAGPSRDDVPVLTL